MLLRILLRVFLCFCLMTWLTLGSGCSTTPVPIQPVPPAKPTTCQLPVPDALNTLPPEFKSLATERLQLEAEFRRDFTKLSAQDRDVKLQRILAIDNRLTQLLVENKTADGVRYQTAVAELHDCQDFVHNLP